MCPHFKFTALGEMSGQFSTMQESHPQLLKSSWFPPWQASLFLPQSHLGLSLKTEMPPSMSTAKTFALEGSVFFHSPQAIAYNKNLLDSGFLPWYPMKDSLVT